MKEVFGTEHVKRSQGTCMGSGDEVWSVLIKDEKGRYPGNPLWGDGRGRALFGTEMPDKQVAVDYKKDCLSCHIPEKEETGSMFKAIRVSGHFNNYEIRQGTTVGNC